MFFGYEDAEDILTYGQPIGEHIVAMVIKSAYPEKFE